MGLLLILGNISKDNKREKKLQTVSENILTYNLSQHPSNVNLLIVFATLRPLTQF